MVGHDTEITDQITATTVQGTGTIDLTFGTTDLVTEITDPIMETTDLVTEIIDPVTEITDLTSIIIHTDSKLFLRTEPFYVNEKYHYYGLY